MRRRLLAIALLLAASGGTRAAKQVNKAIHVSVAAPWGSTPLALEASQFFTPDDAANKQGASRALWWQYAAALPAGTIAQTDQGQYDAAIAAATPLLSTGQLDLLKYALGIRQFSPALQAHRELWPAVSALGCSLAGGAAVAVVNGKLCISDPANLLEAVAAERKAGRRGDSVLNLDHEYSSPTYNATAGTVVHLYAALGSKSFLAFHSVLAAEADAGTIRYALRHVWPASTHDAEQPMLLQGYGVELAIKNMEYKAVDDQQKEAGASVLDAGEEDMQLAGFDFKVLLQRAPDKEVELLSLRDALLSEAREAESTDIKVWALKDLGVQASQRILQAEEPLRLIRDLSHNLPALVNSISRMRVNATIREEIESNRNYMHPGHNVIFVNGRQLPLDALTPYNIYEFVRHEIKTMDRLKGLGMDTRTSRRILNTPGGGGGGGGGMMMGGDDTQFKLDVRDERHVFWLNNIEKDDMYEQWPRSLQALLQRGWPGQLRYVRRNLWTAIYLVDPGSLEDLGLLSEALAMVLHNLPVRFGFIFKSSALPDLSANDSGEAADKEVASAPPDEGVSLYRLFKSLYDRHGARAAFEFADGFFRKAASGLEPARRKEALKDEFKAATKRHRASGSKTKAKYGRDLKDDAADASLRASSAFARGTGVGMQGPVAVVNGVVLEGPALDEQNLHYLLQMQMQELQRLTYFGQIDENQDIYTQYINNGGPAYKRFHKKIVPGRESSEQMLDLHKSSATYKALAQQLGRLPAAICGKDTGAMRALTHVVAVDLAVPTGCSLVREAFQRLALGDSTPQAAGKTRSPADDTMCPHVQVLLLDNSKEETSDDASEAMAVLQQAMAAGTIATDTLALVDSVCSALAANEWQSAKSQAPLAAFAGKSGGKGSADKGDAMTAREQRALTAALFGIESGANAVATSGRVFMVTPEVAFVAGDFQLAESVEWEARSEHVFNVLNSAGEWPGLTAEEVTSEYLGRVAMLAATVVGVEKHEDVVRRDQEAARQWQSKVSGFHVGPALKDALLHVVAFIDPLCVDAQRMAPVLMALAEGFSTHVHVILNPVAEMGALPIKGYYRYVLKPRLEFGADGRVAGALRATFSNLPVSKLLSMNLHPPNAWFVSAAECVHDMDNVLLDKLPPGQNALVFAPTACKILLHTACHVATYRLDHILVTGHCIDESHQPPAGLQLNLHSSGTSGAELVGDTLVMSNLGYFQLKGRPGICPYLVPKCIFNLSTAEGRSREMYEIAPDAAAGDSGAAWRTLSVASWEPQPISLKMHRRAGTHGMRLLESMEQGVGGQAGGGGFGGQEESLWAQMGSMFGVASGGGGGGGGGGGKSVDLATLPSGKQHETIHVFSLASGHLYERFLKIMMLSVVKKTKAPVKFWLLNNFLSPQFKTAIPKMAAHYGFEYEFVTYKWPSWLHQQTEKQRIIWGYKILMLDVLFPLSVKKIIYIDSDQTVRGDLRELYNMDLKGRPYAYTPFCSSNTEMDGYRFWKQGFWQSHLGDTPYHISALYVVDLQRFRQIGAGDQLRVIYSQLSRDPNSLANLDQDLPNYAQHQVPIFSLPQEWLWCETWCSNASKVEAKTIDLCNNPMTKEPKLDQARRIVGEWEEYDAEIRSLEEKCSSDDTSITGGATGAAAAEAARAQEATPSRETSEPLKPSASDETSKQKKKKKKKKKNGDGA